MISPEFLGLLDAAETYFSQDPTPTLHLHSELDDLSQKLEKESKKSEILLHQIDQKQKEFVSLSKYLEEAKSHQTLLETSLKQLKIYSHTLDLETSENLQKIQKFSSFLCLPIHPDHQSPVPIKYKPLSSRVVRRRT
jgi:arginine deiminase